MDCLPVPNAKDLDNLLPWWKVFFYSINLAHYALFLTFTSILGSNLQVNLSTYPVLASLARDFLCSLGSSCAAKHTFSSAADVCSSGQGSLKPKTIEQCVSSHMWLKEGIKLEGNFQKAQKIVMDYEDFCVKKKK